MTNEYRTDATFAQEMDQTDPLASYREKFSIPKTKEDKDCVYFCGNSLGLKPKAVNAALMQELDDWGNMAVEAHFRGKNPWRDYHEFVTKQMAHIVGAKQIEVVMMNSLSVNLHLMMVSFYRPTKDRYKILIEGNAFPSDRYAVESQIKFHGFDPLKSLVEISPREGERTLRTEDIESLIAEQGNEISLIMIGGVNYYTGQLFAMERITKAGHEKGCLVGFDLAHAAGNAALSLHDWDVDFACWCSYKYLNSGPGSLSGCFVHERHAHDSDLPRFAGWWGHDKETRFQMEPHFKPIPGAEGWQISNPPVLSLAAIKASLDIFEEAGMEMLHNKSVALTGYLEFLLDNLNSDDFTIMTPRAADERGCQISIVLAEGGKNVFEALQAGGVVCDWREPDCIRLAPTPLYNSFTDVYKFVQIFAAQIGQSEQLSEAG